MKWNKCTDAVLQTIATATRMINFKQTKDENRL